MIRIPDETLNHWADVYVARNVRDFEVSLDQFLAKPHQTLAWIERRLAARNYVAARRRHPGIDPCEADDHVMQVRDGRLFEKLRHGPACQSPTPFTRRWFRRLFRRAS